MSNKFFEYSMIGLPIIASNLYELNNMIETWDNGWVLENYSVDALLRLVNNIDINHWSFEKARRSSIKLSREYNWEKEEQKLLNLYRKL